MHLDRHAGKLFYCQAIVSALFRLRFLQCCCLFLHYAATGVDISSIEGEYANGASMVFEVPHGTYLLRHQQDSLTDELVLVADAFLDK